MVKNPCVYMLASKRNGTLYTGVTSDLADRVNKHKQDLVEWVDLFDEATGEIFAGPADRARQTRE